MFSMWTGILASWRMGVWGIQCMSLRLSHCPYSVFLHESDQFTLCQVTRGCGFMFRQLHLLKKVKNSIHTLTLTCSTFQIWPWFHSTMVSIPCTSCQGYTAVNPGEMGVAPDQWNLSHPMVSSTSVSLYLHSGISWEGGAWEGRGGDGRGGEGWEGHGRG